MIVLNMIVRDAESTIVKALDSVKPTVDFYVVGFAGESDDNTRELTVSWLEENATDRYILTDFEFIDFADARNRVLDETPEGFAWLLWMDADDIIFNAENIRTLAESAKPEVGAIQLPYVYQTDENGNPTVIHDRERLVRPSLGWRWVRPVHETLFSETPHDVARSDVATYVHQWKANAEIRHDRNMELLRAYYESNPADLRTALYIGHALYSTEDWANAREWFAQYYANPQNQLEQWQAAVFAGDCAQQLDDYENAIGWYHQAIDARPELIDPYVGIAASLTQTGQHDKALAWYKLADQQQMPPSQLFVLPGRYTFNRWAYEHHSLASMGFYEAALQVCEKALEYTNNEHQGFAYYLMGYRETITAQRSLASFRHLVYHLQNRGDALNALEILKFAPKNIVEQPEFEELQRSAHKAVEHLFDPSLDIYSSDEHWAGQSAGAFELEPEKMERVAAVFERLELIASERASVGKKLTIVDIGAGDGGIACRMAEKYGWLVTIIDANPHNIELAKKRAEERGVSDNLKFVCGNASSLAADEVGAHDVAICLEVIEHVIDPASLIMFGMEVANRMIITTPHQAVGAELQNTPDGIHLHHVREFDFGMLCRMAIGVGANIETLDTAYSANNILPGYGSWLLELTPRTELKMPVVFYVGPSVERWTPVQVNTSGIGGSETAVVQMARQFRAAGHAVFVYGEVDGIWDGVFYRHYKHFDPAGPAGGAGALLFVSSRVPEVYDAEINAATKWLWCHDIAYDERVTPERVERMDAILTLSEWQKKVWADKYPFAADKLVVTGNGIDPTRFEGLDWSDREPHRFVWGSSYDRGLERVLDMWPKIRAMWDDAELYVFYGFDTADRIYGATNQAYNAFRNNIIEKLDQPGVVYEGRKSQSELAIAYSQASYWLYPTSFDETYCITALEMQAAGVIPITSDRGALPERILGELWKLSDGAEDDDYIEKLVEYNERGEGYLSEKRNESRTHALSFTWERVFKQWKKLIDQNVKKNISLRKQELADGEQAHTSES